jgi:hypothetical protein
MEINKAKTRRLCLLVPLPYYNWRGCRPFRLFFYLNSMNRLFWILICVVALFSCKAKKKMLTGEDKISADEFVQSFPIIELPVVYSDTTINNKLSDSDLIAPVLLKEFIPDTVFNREFGKGSKPKFYLMGRAADKNEDQYLLLKAATATKQAGYIVCFDKDNKFRAGMLLVTNSGDRNAHYQAGLDKKFTITRNKVKKAADGQFYYNKNVFVYNTAGAFTLILTESNEALEVNEVYNPIDSLARTNKLSGDYIKDRKNLVSIRDAAKPGRVLFFIHFEKNNGECVGELKGEASIIKPNLAQYSAAGDPCSLEFVFANNQVAIKELQGCGNYRGVRCFFEGSYPKKAVKSKPAIKTRKT